MGEKPGQAPRSTKQKKPDGEAVNLLSAHRIRSTLETLTALSLWFSEVQGAKCEVRN